MNRSRRPAPRSSRGPRRRGAPPRRYAPDRARASDSRDEAWTVSDQPVVHVAFRGGRCETFLNPSEVVLRTGDFVILEVERGQDLGRVIAAAAADVRHRRRQALRKVLRQALPEEIERLRGIVQQDADALEVCQSRARHFNLQMRIIDAETQFDGNRITFYFTAEQRVDFRALVRDLASIFRTRIELRQVGARDAARRCDGIGPCGRRLCCTAFLRDFEPVTLKMAKDQHLPLNPAKISGSCGRLMCCLNYEASGYHARDAEDRAEAQPAAAQAASASGEMSAESEEFERSAELLEDSAEMIEDSEEAIEESEEAIEDSAEMIEDSDEGSDQAIEGSEEMIEDSEQAIEDSKETPKRDSEAIAGRKEGDSPPAGDERRRSDPRTHRDDRSHRGRRYDGDRGFRRNRDSSPGDASSRGPRGRGR